MPQPKNELEAQQRKEVALIRLAQGDTVADIAAGLGISPNAVYKWLKQPAFRNRMRQYNDQATFVGLARLHQNFDKAVNVLINDLESGDPNLRHRAAVDYAKIVLDGRRYDEENAELRDHIDKIYEAIKKLDPAAQKVILRAYEGEEDDDMIDTIAVEVDAPADQE